MTTEQSTRRGRLRELATSEGYETVTDLLEAAATDTISPGICMVCGCTGEVEPDQDAGHCESCGGNTVKSALVLAGIV